MWTLHHSSGNLIHIPPDTAITIGRKSCDLTLNDLSVSHLHAKIRVKRHDAVDVGADNKHKLSSICIISDEGSRRGTKIKRKKEIILLPYQDYKLKPSDKISFGANNIWTLSYKKICLLTCGDCDDHIKNLKNIIKNIGGQVFNEWNENCNFYSTICGRVTPKFITALAAGLPFVTLEYWEDFYKSYQTKQELPNPSGYTVKNWKYTDELKNVSLYPMPARKDLFNDIEFVFFSIHQRNAYAEIIEFAGGRPLMCAKYGFSSKHLVSKNTIIVACNENERNFNGCCGLSDSDYRNIRRLLIQEKRKMIDEMEIVKAILLCSREKYCNPAFRKTRNRQNSKENINSPKDLMQKSENTTIQAVSHKNQQDKENLLSIAPENQVVSHKNHQAEENSLSILLGNQVVLHKNEQDMENLLSIPPENPIFEISKRNLSESSNEASWIDVSRNNEEKKASTTCPTIDELPTAIVKLERLSETVISTFRHNKDSDKYQNCLNTKPTDRKRKNFSPNTSANLDSTPDLFTSDDESVVENRLNKEQSFADQVKIIDDKIITSKVILRINNHNSKRRKIEQTSISSWFSPKNNEIEDNFLKNLDTDIQYDCDEHKFQDPSKSSIIIINDDNEVLDYRSSKSVRLSISQKNFSSHDKAKVRSKKNSVTSDDKNLSNVKNVEYSQKGKKSKTLTEKFTVYQASSSHSEIAPSENDMDTNNTSRKLSSGIQDDRINIISDDDNDKMPNNQNAKNDITDKKYHTQQSSTKDHDTKSILQTRQAQFSSLFDNPPSQSRVPKIDQVTKNNPASNKDKGLTSSKEKTNAINEDKTDQNKKFGIDAEVKKQSKCNTEENAIPQFLMRPSNKTCKIDIPLSKPVDENLSNLASFDENGDVIKILNDVVTSILKNHNVPEVHEPELPTVQNNNQHKPVESNSSINKSELGENALPGFFSKF